MIFYDNVSVDRKTFVARKTSADKESSNKRVNEPDALIVFLPVELAV